MARMKTDEIKTLATPLKELNESYIDLLRAMTDTTKEVKATKEFTRKGGNSILIKLGLALIAFPEPVISDIIGVSLVALGTIQGETRRRAIYIEDVYKTFHDTLKEISNIKHRF